MLSIDDPDVRMAAEALGDLRAGISSFHITSASSSPPADPPSDFVQTPPSSSSRNGKQGHRRQASSQPEPLLSLLTSHPLIGPAVRTTAASYSAGKNYSPYFKTTAECVERRVTPVVNKAGTLGRVTGVEGGVRWFLGGRRRNHNRPSNAAQEQPTKRRKMREDNNRDATSSRNSYASTYSYRSEPGQSQVATHTTLSRRDSAASFVESLPAYDEFKSPPYSNTTLSQSHSPSHNPSQTPSICNSHNNSQTSLQKIDENDPNLESWQQKLILTTSGLSIAMSDESLRSLRYCLNLLQWANEHISKVLSALSSLLSDDGPSQNSAVPLSESEAAYQREATVAKIAALKKDVLKTLKEVVDVVSKYAGGALPENAALLVRMHLTSLPQRFQMANADTPRQSEDGQREGLGNVADLEAREGARKVIVLAKEGLDMMSQVSGVVEGTIVSAEEWLGKLGKRSGSSTSLQDEMAKKNIDPLLEQSTYPMLPLPIRHHSSNVDFRMREAS